MACAGYYTGLMLTMAQTALANNQFGTGASNSLFDHVADTVGDFIDSTPFLSDLSSMAQEITGAIGEWGSEVAANFSKIGDGVFNGLGNSLLGEQAGSIFENVAMTEAIKGVSQELLGADISVYLQHVAQANSWTAGRNAIITSAIIDTAEYALQYGTSIDSQVTARLSDVNKALPSFSSELAATGSIINFENLNELGNPVAFMKNLQTQAGGLAVLEPALAAQGINPAKLSQVLSDNAYTNLLANLTIEDALGNSGIIEIPETELVRDSLSGSVTVYGGSAAVARKGLGKAVFDALGSVKGTDLSLLQSVMGSNVSGVDSAQELLDPTKLFPTSYPALTSQAPVERSVSPVLGGIQLAGASVGTAKIYITSDDA